METPMKILAAGDSALAVEFGHEISEPTNHRVRAMQTVLEHQHIQGIMEMVPTYRSLMIHYDPRQLPYEKLCHYVAACEKKMDHLVLPSPHVIEIPTLYGGEAGPDLTTVATNNQLTDDEVIQIHSGRDYLIYMLGFTPGFPYLGGMDPRIATPRLENPRKKIRGGSVGIAGSQTGIYSIDSPGGWQLIGWTPVPLFDPNAEEPFLLKAGNYIRFIPITQEECSKIQEQLSKREFHGHTHRHHSELRGNDTKGGVRNG